MRAIDALFAILFALISVGFFLWGALQLTGVVPYFNAWSDLAALLCSLCFGAAAWLSACTRYVSGRSYF